MGLFSKRKKEGTFTDSPISITVASILSNDRNAVLADCNITKGNVRVGDTLTYKPRFGREVTVTVSRIEAMMMNLEIAMEGTAATITFTGDFIMMTPSEGDEIER